MTDQPDTLSPDLVNAIVRDMDDPRYPTRITVYCDRYGCGAEHIGEYMVSTEMDSEERLAVARQHLAQHEGWKHTTEGDDLCPEHADRTVEEPTACGKCRSPFDPADTRFDGAARYASTPYCRRCVDRCHESTDAFHRCVICQ